MSAAPEPEKPTWHMPQAMKLQLMKAFSDFLEQPASNLTMTYEEFLDWADEDTLAEWVNGEVIMTSPASLEHQLIASFLTKLVGTFVEFRSLGQVVCAPFQMRLAHVPSGREPDVLFVAKAHEDRFKPIYLDGPADLVVEIISPESAGRDRGDKYFEYQEAGIPEYWLIDPRTRRAEFYVLASDGTYQLVEPDDLGIYHSAIIADFWLRIEWLWLIPLIEEAMLEIGGKPYSQSQIDRLQNSP